MPHPNDPKLRSFIPVDPASDFPIQNLPYPNFLNSREKASKINRGLLKVSTTKLGPGCERTSARR